MRETILNRLPLFLLITISFVNQVVGQTTGICLSSSGRLRIRIEIAAGAFPIRPGIGAKNPTRIAKTCNGDCLDKIGQSSCLHRIAGRIYFVPCAEQPHSFQPIWLINGQNRSDFYSIRQRLILSNPRAGLRSHQLSRKPLLFVPDSRPLIHHIRMNCRVVIIWRSL